MKGIYWRPRNVSRGGLAAIAAVAVVGLVLVEHCPFRPADPHREEKVAAAKLAERGMDLIRRERLGRGHPINRYFDPADSGLIGSSMTLVTSVPGNLRAKQTSINPNFAAATVEMLRDAGVKEGDCVAVGCSGSFPALNLAVYAALETLRAKPIVIASVAASQFGANLPDLVWIDMERLLVEKGLVSFRAQAASPGGYEDCALGMCSASRQLIVDAANRNGLRLIEEASLSESIEGRMQLYREAAAGRRIAAYINVGGGAASVGRTEGKRRYRPGLNLRPPRGAIEIDSVMTRFASTGVPVIHLVEVTELATSFGLPIAPKAAPTVGEGGIYHPGRPSRWLAVLVLVTLGAALRTVVLTDGAAKVGTWLRRFRLPEKRRCLSVGDASERALSPEGVALMV